MPATSSVFTNKETRTWVQDDGVGEEFELFSCGALTTWSRDYTDTVYIKCKSPDEYFKQDIKKAVGGEPEEPTFTVEAFTVDEADFLLGLDCPVDFQVHFGACSSPSDVTGYVKIRHFYQARKSSETESNIDYIGEGETAGVQLSVEFTAEEVIEVLQVTVTQQNNGVTEAQDFNDIAFLHNARCEGDCGTEIRACYWGVCVAESTYGVATANVWYTQDAGATWIVCPTDPFAATDADISSCVILAGETAPRIIVFRGNVSGIYGARASISDDWGATWAEVDVGGDTDGHKINGAFKYSAGLICLVGNGGYIWYSENQGDSWTEITGVTTGVATMELWDIHSIDSITFYVVGDDNTAIKSTDGMASWTALAGPADALEHLYTCQSPSEFIVFIGGQVDAGTDCLWRSVDGGTTWTDVDFTNSTLVAGAVRRIRMADKASKNHLVLIHGAEDNGGVRYGAGADFRFLRTLDGGATWERMNLVENLGLNGLDVCNINRAWACGDAVGAVGEIERMAA